MQFRALEPCRLACLGGTCNTASRTSRPKGTFRTPRRRRPRHRKPCHRQRQQPVKGSRTDSQSTAAADYGSAEHHERFAESLENTGASEIQISGRLAAARSEGTHPSAAVSVGQACGEGPQVPSGCSRRLRAGKERSQPLTPGIPCQAGHSRRLQRTRPGKRGSHD